MIFMFGFLDKIFHREKSGDLPIEPEKPFRPIELTSNELIWAQLEGEVPKIWKGIINSVNGEVFMAEIPGLFRESQFPFNEDDDILISISKKDRMGRFKSKIVKIKQENQPPLILLEYPKEVIWKEIVERKHKRMKMDVPAKIKQDTQNAGWVIGRIYNMGIGGLCFRSPELFQKRKDVKVKLMSLDFSHELKGTVVWNSHICGRGQQENLKYNIGIKFYVFDEMLKKAIADFAWKMQDREATNIEQSGFLLRGE
ncbi:MAG: PilZ domain-containing protein [Candidatus Eremiobacteraeota bacterium]|nr:PilZ domain-containing protein [Candidatus Eremiobacteraeota bacterium]